jgi:hypothetical protein
MQMGRSYGMGFGTQTHIDFFDVQGPLRQGVAEEGYRGAVP